jgi:hypothetical protein
MRLCRNAGQRSTAEEDSEKAHVPIAASDLDTDRKVTNTLSPTPFSTVTQALNWANVFGVSETGFTRLR